MFCFYFFCSEENPIGELDLSRRRRCRRDMVVVVDKD
jgi:hypothetical protein